MTISDEDVADEVELQTLVSIIAYSALILDFMISQHFPIIEDIFNYFEDKGGLWSYIRPTIKLIIFGTWITFLYFTVQKLNFTKELKDQQKDEKDKEEGE